jgi:hypothetical protein
MRYDQDAINLFKDQDNVKLFVSFIKKLVWFS